MLLGPGSGMVSSLEIYCSERASELLGGEGRCPTTLMAGITPPAPLIESPEVATDSQSHYASHPLVGTAGIPLVVYPGLKLNFLRPAFLTAIKDFEPDVVHFVDPIWLGAQTLVAMELGWAGAEWVPERGPAVGTGLAGAVVASYHT